MKKIILCIFLAVAGFSTYACMGQAAKPTQQPQQPYVAKDYSYLLGMEGISDKTLQIHFTLYHDLVKNTNQYLTLLNNYAKEGKAKTMQYDDLKRQFAFWFDGMRLHELYFSNLGKNKTSLDVKSPLYKRIEQDFGSFDAWKENFINTSLIVGDGWVILYKDPVSGKLINMWVSEHQNGHMAGGIPILVMDVWEHAYLLDYGIDTSGYIKAFLNNVNWNEVSKRF